MLFNPPFKKRSKGTGVAEAKNYFKFVFRDFAILFF